jgi:hypothetical protein
MNESRLPEDEPERHESSRPVFIEFSESELIKRAVQVGKVAGTAVALFRDAQRRFREPGRIQDDRIGEFTAAAKSRVWELRREAAEHAEDWRRAALEKTAELRKQTKARYEQARARANQVGRDYPVQLIVAAGVVGFLIGAGLRIRRAHRG